ncbi:MAG: indole-3-glycerol phosphate synthase [Saprospiraceae bacterium]|jgi:indole-3-glycerol phosphate synthase
MTILETIIENKKKEIVQSKKLVSLIELKEQPYFNRTCLNFPEAIMTGTGIISEFKRKSPSKGLINGKVSVQEVVSGYAKANVSAVSVLTDTKFFGGTFNDVLLARETIDVPILRKDFMVDEYQLHEAKAMGADVILLIASALSVNQTNELASAAKSLGLNVFLEIHNHDELAHFGSDIDVVGINNRDLKTFTIDIENSIRLSKELPTNVPKVAESGISSPETLLKMKNEGFNGFLIGENFMRSENPGKSCKEFIDACAI